MYIRHIGNLLHEYPDHSMCLTAGSKSNYKRAQSYSAASSIIPHPIRNCISFLRKKQSSHLTQIPPIGRCLFLTDSLSSPQSLQETPFTSPRIERIIHSTLFFSLKLIAESRSFGFRVTLTCRNTMLPLIWPLTSLRLQKLFVNSLLLANDYYNHLGSHPQIMEFILEKSIPNKLLTIKQSVHPSHSPTEPLNEKS